MKIFRNKFILMPLALLFYVLIMFIIETPFIDFTKALFHYDYFVALINVSNPLSLFYEQANNYLVALNVFLESFIYTIVFLGLFLLLYYFIKNDLDIFLKQKTKYWRIVLISFAIYYVTNFIVNILTILLQLLFNSTPVSQNQASLESLINFDFYGLMMFFPIVLIGPLVEELIFRKCFFSLIPNKILAFILNCLCFGLLHTISYSYNWSDLLIVTIPYCCAGIAFSYCYMKTNNVFASYLLHALLNFISYFLIITTNLGGI